MSYLSSFISELKRRSVVRVGIVYATVAFAALEGADILLPALGLPTRIMTVLAVLAIAGLPLALGLAWVFELRREKPPGAPSSEKVGAAVEGQAAAADVRAGTSDSDLRTFARLFWKPAIGLPWLLVLVLAAAAVIVPNWLRLRREAARALIPRIERLAGEGEYRAAYGLAVRAEARLGPDSALHQLMAIVSDRLSVTTEPDGADVYMRPYAPDAEGRFPEREWLGAAPVLDIQVPRGDYAVYLELEGYAPAERIASSALQRAEGALFGGSYAIDLSLTLLPSAEVPDDMVFVPGGAYQLVAVDAPLGAVAQLDDYFIDRYEVSNELYKAFILASGYAERSYWRHCFVRDGEELSWEEAMAVFTDRTGLPGPRSWVGQDYPEGRDRHPVTDITWYEAAAYAEFAGKSLPTVFQWEKAARDGAYSHFEGVVMPWGYMGPGQTGRRRANFSGDGTAPVDAYPFGVSPFGAHAMAGNVKEWTLNEMGDGRVVTGGSWEDPMYVFSAFGSFPGFHSSPALGFRCVRNSPNAAGDQGAMHIDVERTPTYTPVDEATFRSFLTHYRYDPQPLAPVVIEVVDTEDWTREKVRFNGLDGDSILAYLYLPKRATPPFQTIVFVPGVSVFFSETVSEEVEWLLEANVKAGRAVMAVVMKGMIEREWGPGYVPPEPSSVRFRDLMVLHATELRLGLDYLETRSDIDSDKLAYVGLSWGAGSRLLFAALDDRFKSVVFLGGGIDETMQPTLPEASNINFAPYIGAPTLLLNGRQDEEHRYDTRALPLWNLLREPKKFVLVDGAGHVPPAVARVPAINGWLDETLGPPRR
jgi:formylglycine-generating enzyme required for sulfatase activity/dienelactone hydrolase